MLNATADHQVCFACPRRAAQKPLVVIFILATKYCIPFLFSLQRLLLKYGWGVARSQRDEIERMVRSLTLCSMVAALSKR
jgi:hypothetical protein